MEFICQLRNGYMLAEDNNEYKVVRTGYPYPDTRLSSQAMLNELVEKLQIKKTDYEITISLLADRLEPIFDNDAVFSEKVFKTILEDCIENEREIKGHIYSVFFSSPFFSIYYFYDSDEAIAYFSGTELTDYTVFFKRTDAAIILHFHVDKNTVKLPEPFDRKKEPVFANFDAIFKENYGVSVEQMETMLSSADKHRGSLTKDKLLDLTSPFEGLDCVHSSVENNGSIDNLNLSFALKTIFLTIDTMLSFSDLAKINNPGYPVLSSVAKEIFGYNIIRGLFCSELYFDLKLQTFGLSCILYYIETDAVTKCILKTRIKSLVKEFIATREVGTLDVKFVSIDGNIHVRTFPYAYEIFQHGNFNSIGCISFQTNLLLGGDTTNKCIVEDEDGLCWYDIDLSRVLKGVSSYENKLFQFWVAIFVQEFNVNKLELGHTEYSVRNVIKTMVPNFDRLLLMGAFNETTPNGVLVSRYNVSLFETYDRDKVVRVLDDALDEENFFTDIEKSFIMALYTFMKSIETDNGVTTVRITLLVKHSEYMELLKPKFREGFLEHIEPIIKMYVVVNRCSNVYGMAEYIKKHDMDFSFDGLSFVVTIKRKKDVQ